MAKRSLLPVSAPVLDTSIVAMITRRRRQLMVHSAIYYRLGTSLIEDKLFDKWAYELVDLQKKYPEESKKADLYEDFKDWDGTTGYNLNYTGFLGLADYLINICEVDKLYEHTKLQ